MYTLDLIPVGVPKYCFRSSEQSTQYMKLIYTQELSTGTLYESKGNKYITVYSIVTSCL